MSKKKVKVWLDTGASIHSAFREELSVEEFGFTEEEWNGMDEGDQFDIVTDMCIGFDWGVVFVDEEEN